MVKIKDSTIYYYYEKLYNLFKYNKYKTIKDFLYDLSMNSIITENQTIDIIITSLIKCVNNENEPEYLAKTNLSIHTSLLIFISNDNFIYLLENKNKTFKDVFGTKSQFSITSKLIDIIGNNSLKEMKNGKKYKIDSLGDGNIQSRQ